MSAFLWVEDFDDLRYRQVAFEHFGEALKHPPEMFPGDLPGLVRFLKDRSITLATTYAEGRRLIDGRLSEFDFVVLDIDLALVGEDSEEDGPFVQPDLERWYDYDPQATDEETSYNNARNKMKRVAGYHLWTNLIIDRGFPRERIKFCSQHGDHLDSIKKSFEPAKIVAPEICRKGDGKIGAWVAESSRQPYVSLRRNVIGYCDAVREYLESFLWEPKSVLRLTQLPGETTSDFTIDLALEMLEGLPHYLFPNALKENESIPTILKAFVRAMTIEWDRFSAAKNDRASFEQREGKSYDEAIPKNIQCGASVMKLLRNTVSHKSNSSIEFDCQEVALFFVLNMNTVFNLERMTAQKVHEARLLGVVGKCVQYESVSFFNRLKESETELIFLVTRNELTSPSDRVGDLLRCLQRGGVVEYQRECGKWLLRMLWHELTSRSKVDKATNFSEHMNEISSSNDPIHNVASASLHKAFLIPRHI